MASNSSTRRYKRINTGGDWGVGIVTDDRYPQNKGVILSTSGLVGCNALFFTSPKGIWLCHVMSTWVSSDSLEKMNMKLSDLYDNLNKAVLEFETHTGTPIAKVYICEGDANSDLRKILEDWTKGKRFKVHVETPGVRAWFANSSGKFPLVGEPPARLHSSEILDYQLGEREEYSRARHLEVGMPGVWSNPFIPSPFLGRDGPRYEGDPRPILPMASSAPSAASGRLAETDNKAGLDLLAANFLRGSSPLRLDASAAVPAPSSVAHASSLHSDAPFVGADSQPILHRPVPMSCFDELASRIAGAHDSFDRLSAGLPASASLTSLSGSMPHLSMPMSRPPGSTLAGGVSLPVEMKAGGERLKAIDIEQQRINMQISVLKSPEVHRPVAKRPGDYVPPLLGFHSPAVPNPREDRAKQLSLLQAQFDELEREKQVLLSNRTGSGTFRPF